MHGGVDHKTQTCVGFGATVCADLTKVKVEARYCMRCSYVQNQNHYQVCYLSVVPYHITSAGKKFADSANDIVESQFTVSFKAQQAYSTSWLDFNRVENDHEYLSGDHGIT